MKAQRSKGWPASQDELKASKQILFDRLSFVQVMNKYTNKIEDTGSASFTHRCTCPNPKHKNGGERTPSFYFSEDDKGFRCFGCGLNGDIFDLIGLMEGMPWSEVVKLFLKKEEIDIHTVDLDFSAVQSSTFQQYVFDVNLKLSSTLRDYLHSLRNTEHYKDEKQWVDLIFRRIDNRLEKAQDGNKEAIRELEVQVMLEIERRRSKLDGAV